MKNATGGLVAFLLISLYLEALFGVDGSGSDTWPISNVSLLPIDINDTALCRVNSNPFLIIPDKINLLIVSVPDHLANNIYKIRANSRNPQITVNNLSGLNDQTTNDSSRYLQLCTTVTYCLRLDALFSTNYSSSLERFTSPTSITSFVDIEIFNTESNMTLSKCNTKVVALNDKSFARQLFNVIIIIMAIGISLMMGCVLDLSIVKVVLKHPKCPIIGFITQFGMMPLIAFSIAKIARFPAPEALGLFIVGCSPGGSNSNQWTLIFDGDIEVSAVMTLVSTVSSFAMMPIWLYSLGKLFTKQLNLKIPFFDLAKNLAMIVIPYALGCGISTWKPKIRMAMQVIIKPVFIAVLFMFLTLGIYVNLPFFKMLQLKQALMAPLLPWLGFILGSLASFICRLNWKQIKTVGIETGFQNIGIAFLIIRSFPLQENIRASVVIVVVAFLTALPLWILLIVRTIYRRCIKRQFNFLHNEHNHSNIEYSVIETSNVDYK
ncbi:hypothetical protein GJ496_002222 [Pomphorhynchus laevis]|nr:hypothetical protein GJ496_002222 [Pomphorhynchus laevis]